MTERGTEPRVAIRAPERSLFPSPEERRRMETWLSEELANAHTAIQAGPVTPTLDMAAFRRALGEFDFEHPRPLHEVMQWTIECMTHGIVQMGNPRYFGLFNPGASFPAQCADRIASLFNPQLASSASSPVPVEIERQLIQQVARRAGFRADTTGHFATGGSEANLTGLLCALTDAHADFATDGARAFPGPVRFYTSTACHIAWLKIAHQAGIGRSALHLVPTDGQGRLDPLALRTAIAADRARGLVPVMVVATAGTTGGGMIDPLEECAEIAHAERLWYHVDAAWGGAALASKRLSGLLSGIEHADSVTIDAHKWFATTMGCAMFIIQGRGGLLSRTFHASADFMPSNVSGIDPYLNSVPWSRRFLGLRLFLALGAAGWDGYASHVERSVEVIAAVQRCLVATGWEIANRSSLAVLNAIPPPGLGAVRPLVQRLVTSGRAWAAATTFEGREVVRICATHGESTQSDIDALVNALNGKVEA